MTTESKKSYTYFLNTENGKLYRTALVLFSTGEEGESLERYSFDFNNWNGHIHNHEETAKQICARLSILEITEEKAFKIIKTGKY